MTGSPPGPLVLLEVDDIATAVRRLAADLSARHDDGVVLVGVLKGSVVFLADLVRAMTIQPVVDFLAVSPYEHGTSRVRLVKDLDVDVSGRDVVLVEEIVDTGLTVAFLTGSLQRRGAASVEVCTLLDRRARRIVPVAPAYIGFAVPDVYLVGYGLDYEGRYRNVGILAIGDLSELSDDPDAYVASLYGDSVS